MGSKQMKLTEQDLQFIVENAVQVYLNENETDESVWGGMKNAMKGVAHGNLNLANSYATGNWASSFAKYTQQAEKILRQLRKIAIKSRNENVANSLEDVYKNIQNISDQYTQMAKQTTERGVHTYDSNINNPFGQQEQRLKNLENQLRVAQRKAGKNVNAQRKIQGLKAQIGQYEEKIKQLEQQAQNGGDMRQQMVLMNQWIGNLTKFVGNLTNGQNFQNVENQSNEGYIRRGKVINEDGGIVGDAAANASGFMNGANNAQTSSNAQFDVPFGSVQRKKIYSPKGGKSSKMTKVDMTPALKRKNGKGGSISINHVDESKVNNIISRSINNCLRKK